MNAAHSRFNKDTCLVGHFKFQHNASGFGHIGFERKGSSQKDSLYSNSQEMAVSSNDTGSDHGQTEPEYSQGFKIGIILFLSIAAVVGFLGNGLVVGVILRAKKLKSVMNRFILHLAVSDMIVSVIAIPLFLFINFNDGLLNDGKSVTVCKIARFFQYLSPEASMTLLITIGWNRHQAVVHPLNIMTYRTANRLIMAAWIYALVVVSPSLYLTKLQQTAVDPVTNKSLTYCATIPATTTLNTVYVMFLGLFGYIIPLISLIALYGKIYKTVWRRKSGQLGDSRPVEAFIRSRKKVLKMFLTVILVFLLTWVPLFLYISAIETTIKSSSSHVDYARLVTYSLGLCNSVCNPFIYALFNAKFRAGCKEMCTVSFLKALRRKKSPVDANAAQSRTALEPPKHVWSRRGGFHGTKGEDKKKSEKKEKQETEKEKKVEESSTKTTPVGQIIGRRFRSLTDPTDAVPKDWTEAVHLVSFQKTLDSEQIVLHFPGRESPQTMNSQPCNRPNCVKFRDCIFGDDSESDSSADAPENHTSTESNGNVAEKVKDGYSILKNNQSSPFTTKRTRTLSEGHARDRSKRGFKKARIRSTPAVQ